MRKILFGLFVIVGISNNAVAAVSGFNLIEDGTYVYDAAAAGAESTPAQDAVDQAKLLGANHIILNVRAIMKGPRSTELVPTTPPAERANEAKRIARLAKYIKEQGMTVGLRPIFFVVGPNGEFPYVETLPDGSKKTWWHGNIQPSDPNRWFESFRVFLDMYLTVAQIIKAEEFTVGAELYSMTVGIEDQWIEYPYGFPGRWLELLRFVRKKLPKARLMYDINFTDDAVNSNGLSASGGEFERWRYRLADLANPTNPAELQIWKDLVSFWRELDAIGIDMYRSLASANQPVPEIYPELVNFLKQRTDSFATQIDTALLQISIETEVDKPLIFKEVGFRSVDNGFIDPFAYAGSGTVNTAHQAASIEALFESFIGSNWPWLQGMNLWEISLDPAKRGVKDNGFSPVGKQQSEDVIKKYYKN